MFSEKHPPISRYDENLPFARRLQVFYDMPEIGYAKAIPLPYEGNTVIEDLPEAGFYKPSPIDPSSNPKYDPSYDYIKGKNTHRFLPSGRKMTFLNMFLDAMNTRIM